MTFYIKFGFKNILFSEMVKMPNLKARNGVGKMRIEDYLEINRLIKEKTSGPLYDIVL